MTEPALGTRVVARPMIPCQACRFCTAGAESVCEKPVYIGVHRPGGFAELVALPARAVFPLPGVLTFESAAVTAHSIPVAIHLLETVGGVGPGDRVLVVGAAGGLGLAALQLAHHLGATTIAALADRAKLAGRPDLPADAIVEYADPTTLAAQVRAVTDGMGATVAVDNVGSPELWPEVVASLDKGGRILTCGAHGGGVVTLDLSQFYRLQLRLLATAGTSVEEFRRALELVASGVIRPVCHGTWTLGTIGDAFREILARRNTGKVVVRIAA